MSTRKNSIPVSLNTAYTWLNRYEEESGLRPVLRQLSERMAANITANDFRSGWANLRELIKFVEPPCDTRESIEILIICGCAAFHMRDETEAIKMLKDACSRALVDKHQGAVASWMLGYILWLLPSLNMHEAMLAWQASIDNFDYLARQRSLTSEKAQWYKNRWDEMRKSLEETIKVGGISSSIPQNARQPTASTPPNPSSPGGPTITSIKMHQVLSIPVIGKIPAGKPANLAEQSGTMAFEEVILDDFFYRILSLKRGENIVNLPDGKDYYILKVSGNSMNKAAPEPIMDEDYVLIHAQNIASQGDIVAAEIVGVDDERATLKRYYFEDGKPLLMPESDDPAFQNPIFFRPHDEVYIRGVALAVLKRLED